MFDKYSGYIYSAWGISLFILITITVYSVLQVSNYQKQLDTLESIEENNE